LLLCIAVLVAGCGADAETMPADEWARRVEELCDKNANQAEREMVEIVREMQREGGSEEAMLARAIDASVELTEPLLEEIRALPNAAQSARASARDLDIHACIPDETLELK
jgi:hypothetical protein